MDEPAQDPPEGDLGPRKRGKVRWPPLNMRMPRHMQQRTFSARADWAAPARSRMLLHCYVLRGAACVPQFHEP